MAATATAQRKIDTHFMTASTSSRSLASKKVTCASSAGRYYQNSSRRENGGKSMLYTIRKSTEHEADKQLIPVFPRRIVLLRHAESDGNVNKKVFEHTPDWQIELTDDGVNHAETTGLNLRRFIEQEDGGYEDWLKARADTCSSDGEGKYNGVDLSVDTRDHGVKPTRSRGGTVDRFFARNHYYTSKSPYSVFFFSSPYKRSAQTLQHVAKAFPSDVIIKAVEDPQLREQDFGNFQCNDSMSNHIMPERQRFGRFFYRFPNGGESGADVYDRITIFEDHLVRDIETGRFPENCTVIIVTHGLTLRLFLMRWFHWTVSELEEV